MPARSSLPHSRAQLKQYTDSSTGVTFFYPAVWNQLPKLETFSGSYLFQKQPARAIVEFTGAGNLYKHTALSSLDFLYGPQPAATREDCRDLAILNPDRTDEPLSTVVIHGTTFTHGMDASAASGHGLGSDVYTTWRNGKCFAFEEDFNIDNADPEVAHLLTPTQNRALQSHLDAIMRSVTFRPAKP